MPVRVGEQVTPEETREAKLIKQLTGISEPCAAARMG